jgi:hypothetical protein
VVLPPRLFSQQRFVDRGNKNLPTNVGWQMMVLILSVTYTGYYFTRDNEPGGIENATHNTYPKLTMRKQA